MGFTTYAIGNSREDYTMREIATKLATHNSRLWSENKEIARRKGIDPQTFHATRAYRGFLQAGKGLSGEEADRMAEERFGISLSD